MTEEMEPSVTMSDYSSDSSDSSIYSSGTSSVAVINSEVSSYSKETDSDIDVSSIKPYQFEPSTETLDISSEESSEEDNENDERLTNMDW